MKIIDKEATAAWLSSNRLLDATGRMHYSGYLEPLQYKLPQDSGAKTALSKLIASFFSIDSEALLWIDEFGIWPSAENRNLFDGYRRSLGETEPLHSRPGHIFSNNEIDSIGSLVAMTLYFCWGAVLVSNARNFVIRISHDEFIDVYAKDKNMLVELKNRISELLQ